jgi:signal peptidase II
MSSRAETAEAAEAAPPRPARGAREADRLRPPLLAAALAGVVLAADRVTKHAVRADIPLDGSRRVIGGILRLVHYRNTGVAFDFLSGAGVIVLVVTGIALVALLGYFALHPRRRGLWVPTGLLLGGAIGNLLDRLLDGSVTDFIKLPHWPAFNVSDIAITIGVIALLWVLERPAARRR